MSQFTATGVELAALAPEVRKKAIAQSYQGKGLGGMVVADAVLRTARAEMGVFALLVDAKDESAQRFYEHYGFTLLPGDARRLCLPIATALRRLG